MKSEFQVGILVEDAKKKKSTTLKTFIEKMEKKGVVVTRIAKKRPKDQVAIVFAKDKKVAVIGKGDEPDLINNDFAILFNYIKAKRIKIDVLLCTARNNDKYSIANMLSIFNNLKHNESRLNWKKCKIRCFSVKDVLINKKGKTEFDCNKDSDVLIKILNLN